MRVGAAEELAKTADAAAQRLAANAAFEDCGGGCHRKLSKVVLASDEDTAIS